MNEKDFADMIRIARRAPLQNMDEAEDVAALLQRFAAYSSAELEKLQPKQPTAIEEICTNSERKR